MNDFSELENDLKALRPAQPSPVIFERIEEALTDEGALSAAGARWGWRRFIGWSRFGAKEDLQEQPGAAKEGRPLSAFKFGIGLAAASAAVLLLIARINIDNTGTAQNRNTDVAQASPPSGTKAVSPSFSAGSGVDRSVASSKFVPSGATQVVYNTRDEGLQFADGSRQPLRRLRYQTQQTWQWRNPSTGASLRVSYPSEEVVLIPVSGQ